ncbi:MAG: hypothetical protein MUP99_06370, partial [Pedobacter sp.]|nr:hypothetical protein [Pedobacter sp.]
MKYIFRTFLFGLSLIIVSMTSCKKSETQPAEVLDTLDQLLNKSYSLVDPATHKAINFGLSGGIQYPYDRMTLSSGTIFIQKVNENYIISESKAGLEKSIQNFIPLQLTQQNTSYNDTYYIKFNAAAKLFSYQLMG